MIKPEQVPDEVVKRFATWQFPKCTDRLMRAMLADALSAWPGWEGSWTGDGDTLRRTIILPLTQENDDD